MLGLKLNSRKVNTPLLKKTIKLNLPIQVDFFVYQFDKLRMFQFYYDFLNKYLDRADFQMDTDSAYIAISGESVESLVKPELRVEFDQDKCKHKAYDKRKPGLFKVEWEGQGIVALCFKTYYCFGAKDKFSCKGVNKKCNDINKDKYLQVFTVQSSQQHHVYLCSSLRCTLVFLS